MTFEDNLIKLSMIVAELEKGDIPLEKAIQLYESGISLAEKCKKELEEAKLKITMN